MSLLFLEPLPRRASKADLLAFLERVGGLDRGRVGRIEFQASRAVIEVPNGWESRLARTLDGQTLGERRVRVWTGPAPAQAGGDEDHFQRLERLLEWEREAEAQQAAELSRRFSGAEAERTGNALVDLAIADEDTGLGGRYLLQLVKRRRALLPWTRLDVGSPVLLAPEAARHMAAGWRGVVYQRDDRSVRIALPGAPDELGDFETWRLDLAGDEVVAQRQQQALRRARSAAGERLAELRDVLCGEREPRFGKETDDPPLDPSLNDIQQAAVRFALSAQHVALIHGPPGTGKTTAVVELIRQAIRRGQRVLACAPSNLGVDNLFERLLAAGQRAVRLGHPARVLPQLREHTLDLLVAQHPDVRLARKLVKEALGLFRQAGRFTRAKPEPGARRQTRQEARSLLDDARRLERQAVEHLLDTADVLCATLTGLDSELIGTRRFDLAVIDEACQSVEPGCWIPLARCDRVVLAGDHCQLPPTVVSQSAANEGLGISMFERLMERYGRSIARRLTIQYRMHEQIMDFPSLEFYEAELTAHESVRGHLLADLPGLAAVPLTQTPIQWLDTAGAGFDEEVEPDGESRRNPPEAELVVRYVRQLLASGLAPQDLAVIAPYAAQVRLLRSQLPVPGLEIDSVDGFQGREKEAVVISLVRSNSQGEIGFLADARRMNGALPRARRKLLIIGDTATLAGHPFYARLIEYVEAAHGYRTVWEEPAANDPN